MQSALELPSRVGWPGQSRPRPDVVGLPVSLPASRNSAAIAQRVQLGITVPARSHPWQPSTASVHNWDLASQSLAVCQLHLECSCSLAEH